MREIELKSVVPDEGAVRRRLEALGASLVFAGSLADRRYDTPDRSLAQRDEVLRLRVESQNGSQRARLDFKGPASFPSGYKLREETSTPIEDHDALHAILGSLGYRVTREIDREVSVYVHAGASIRFERYPRMDALVEVEGAPAAIEAAIEALGLPRAGFTTESLASFAARYETRTGRRAAICIRELDDDFRYRLDDA
jgi:predicted adenylyl cyclase CyaB